MNNELIEAATAVIARWDSTDWKAAPTAEVMNRLRAALSAKLEHAAEIERLKALEDAVDHELAISLEATLDSYHSAKEAVKQLLDWHSEVAIDPRVSSEARALIEQGRMEALAYEPPIPNEIKGRVQAEWFWKGVLAMKEQEKTK